MSDITSTHNYNIDVLKQLPKPSEIYVPNKVEYNLRKYVPKKSLKEIDKNLNVAIEKCLLVISNLVSLAYSDDNYKRLHSTIIHNQTKCVNDNTFIYKKVLNVLTQGTKKTGPMILDNFGYLQGELSKSYSLGPAYNEKGWKKYTLKTEYLIKRRERLFHSQIVEALDNPIAKNLLNVYLTIELPSEERLLEVGKSLAKNKVRNNKGKLYTLRNRHADGYWTDKEPRSFIEDDIERFKLLTADGYLIPNIGDSKSGGRVTDSFTLMPSWIRKEIKIAGEKLCEADYTALHPNICAKIYNGSFSYLTHKKVAEMAGIDVLKVKIEHLSFFNKKWNMMVTSPLFEHYRMTEMFMMENIYKDKKAHGHKITSMKLFKAEVDVLTDVIVKLNSLSINVVYVYDALMCSPKDIDIVKEIMNEVILSHDIKTSVKISTIYKSYIKKEKSEAFHQISSLAIHKRVA